MSLSPHFPQLLHTYFNDWLVGQRNIARHTIRSYRDTWRLFLRFVSQQERCRVVDITFDQLTAEAVLAFLQHLEEERQVSIPTRNCRLAALLRRQPRAPDEPIFVNRYGHPLGASGVRYQLRRYVKSAAVQMPTLRDKHITPHTFRHTAAVCLVAAGVDVTVIRSWLGHANLDTVNRYAQASLETRRQALERIADQADIGKAPSWKGDDALLTWLESL